MAHWASFGHDIDLDGRGIFMEWIAIVLITIAVFAPAVMTFPQIGRDSDGDINGYSKWPWFLGLVLAGFLIWVMLTFAHPIS